MSYVFIIIGILRLHKLIDGNIVPVSLSNKKLFAHVKEPFTCCFSRQLRKKDVKLLLF